MLRFPSAAALLCVVASAAPAGAEQRLSPTGRPVAGAMRLADSSGFATGDRSLVAERARLKSELARVNAEIDALKHGSSGVGADYRLRQRLADAEAVAKRLTEIEARLGLAAGAVGPTTAPPPARPLPVPGPADGPSELEAKADILSDQSRRYRAEAQAFAQRAHDVKLRQELRGRAAELDQDPFAPMEGSKRRVASSAGVATSTPVGNRGGIFSAPASSHTEPATSAGNSNGASPPPSADGSPRGVGAAAPGNGSSGSVAGGTAPQLGGPLVGTPTTTAGAPVATSPTVQLRDTLDTGTLAEIWRADGSLNPGASPRALERAARALEQRAQDLEARARAMRAQAHPAR